MNDVAQKPSLTSFTVETEVYSGPLDLLIQLIEKRKLLINDISLATVTDDYLRYVSVMEQKQLKDMSEFAVLASTLLLIKSKSLLPVLDLTSEEEESIDELEERLKLYQIYRTAARDIEERFGKRVLFERRYVPPDVQLFVTDGYTNTDQLAEVIADVLARLPKKEVPPRAQVRKTVSLEEMLIRLEERIERQLRVRFRDFAADSSERATVIVGFLAVLEMVKQGGVIVRQKHQFSDIEIERDGTRVPRYM